MVLNAIERLAGCVLAFFAAVAISGCDQERSPSLILVPADYEGVVVTVWGQAGFPALAVENGSLVQEYPADGIIITSTPLEFGAARDRFFDVKDDGSRGLRRVPRFGGVGETSLDEGPNIQYTFQLFGSDEFWKGKDDTECDRKVEEAKRKLRRLR